MHELSIATEIVRIAEKETANANMSKVEKIEIEIGALAGIELQALEFVWSSAVKGTVLQDSIKKITVLPGEAQCSECKCLYRLDYIYDNCPECNSYLKTITKGKGLFVKTLELCSIR